MRFHRDSILTPWSSGHNDNTLFSFSLNDGMLYRCPSLSTEMNGIMLDIIGMIRDVYDELNIDVEGDEMEYNFNDAMHEVFYDRMIKLLRDRKIKSLVE